MTSTAVEAQAPQALTMRQLVARRLREARKRRAMSMEALAERCAELGAPELTYGVMVSLEHARREPTVRQIFVLALALDIAPVHLVSLAEDGSEALAVSDTATVSDPMRLVRWIGGQEALAYGDSRAYNAAAIQRAPLPSEATPASEYGQLFLQQRAAEVAAQFQAETARTLAGAREQVRGIIGRLRDDIAAGRSIDELLSQLDAVTDATDRAT